MSRAMNNARTATFVNMLAQFNPRSFISASLVDLDRGLMAYNKTEFHHIYPKAYLEKRTEYSGSATNCLANFCFLSRADNSAIRAKSPSEYRSLMPTDEAVLEEVLSSALISSDLLFADDYVQFVDARAKVLAGVANSLLG